MRSTRLISTLAAAVVLGVAVGACSARAAEREDILIADFEGEDYGDWTVEGEALGPGPARGTLPRQMHVTGFRGKGLVNTFYHGDGTTGTLTSPEFAIQRKFLNFLIGGGGYPGKTCINLLVGGKVARSATGPNTRPGGSEALRWHAWDVADLEGKKATLRIVDDATGGWGHVNVDHVLQSDGTMALPPEQLQRTVRLEKTYLNLPVANGAAKHRMEVLIGGEVVRAFDIELAPDEPDWWAYINVRKWHGQEALLKIDAMEPGSGGLKIVDQTDEIKGAENLYDEPLRPQFHFSQKRGWNNDPNGMVYDDGEYHLFFQHNPYGIRWGNMTWGHAVSPDLVHWQQLDEAIHPDEHGTIFSGSAVADRRNTSGLEGDGEHPPLVCVFTYAGRFGTPPRPFTQGIAYSVDRGRTFTTYPEPVLGNHGPSNRDPKVIWHEPTGQWVMLLYLGQRSRFAFFGSDDLKTWTKLSDFTFPDGHECPEIFELPVDGDPADTRWVVYSGDARYALGSFDGKAFTPEHEGKHQVHWGAFYASQTFNNTPDGRRIQIGWGRINLDGMPFNQMMTFPCVLTLRTTGEGIRMFAEPVAEIELLHAKSYELVTTAITPEQPAAVETAGRLFDIRAEFQLAAADGAKAFGLQIGDARVAYDVDGAKLEGMPLKPVDGKVHVQVLVDRPSMEVCGNHGRVYLTRPFRSDGEIGQVQLFAEGGDVTLVSLAVHELRSAWSP